MIQREGIVVFIVVIPGVQAAGVVFGIWRLDLDCVCSSFFREKSVPFFN